MNQPKYNDKNLIPNLRAAMKREKMKPAHLAKAMNTSRARVHTFLHGKYKPKFEMVTAILNGCPNITFEELTK